MTKTVAEVMTKDPVAVHLEVMLTEAAKIMRDHAIGDVLVTSNGHLCGMLTDRDIVVRAVAENRDPHRTTVGDVCSADIAAVEPDADADDAVALMRARAVRRVPVVTDGEPVGIVSMGDLAREHDETSVLADISQAPPSQ
ncbi:MAG TPA: CBS domain-containing protein [Streptosporangiaceae bacterium]|nr:CBS domain-containing protein [Streptosporangiaceae bacterium]